MINNFIKNLLKIKQYKLKLYNSGKDNITYEVNPTMGNSFIVQQLLGKKSKKNQEFIEKITKYINNMNTIKFADNYLDNRFIPFEGNLFQVMEKINGNSISEKDINIKLIKSTAKYIALFHNNTKDFNYNNYIEINYYKKMHTYRLELKNLLKDSLIKEVEEIFIKMDKIALNLKENEKLEKGIIHGDSSFKNFLIDQSSKIVGLIDYDMLSVNTILWDLSDLIRSYMKIENFAKKEFKILINSYNSIRKLSEIENRELKNYCTMMILDTGFRYLLSAFELNTQKNLLGDKNDSIKKANRCLLEIKKLNTFYN